MPAEVIFVTRPRYMSGYPVCDALSEIDVHQQVQITEVELQPPWTLRQRVLPVHAEPLILRVLPLPLSTHTKASHCEYGV